MFVGLGEGRERVRVYLETCDACSCLETGGVEKRASETEHCRLMSYVLSDKCVIGTGEARPALRWVGKKQLAIQASFLIGFAAFTTLSTFTAVTQKDGFVAHDRSKNRYGISHSRSCSNILLSSTSHTLRSSIGCRYCRAPSFLPHWRRSSAFTIYMDPSVAAIFPFGAPATMGACCS